MPALMLDLRMVEGRLHGIARYALELARRVPSLLGPRWRVLGLTGPGGLGDVGSLKPDLPLVRCPAGFLSALEQPALLSSLFGARVGLFHATSFSVPLLWPGAVVATLHDANHLALPENYGRHKLAYFRYVLLPRLRRARGLLTVSEFSRRELEKFLGPKAPRIQVTYPGVDARFRPPAADEVAAFKAQHGLPSRFFLTVGNEKPHKNLAVLAKAAPQLPGPLVLLAGRGVKDQLGFPDSTVELSEISEAQMPALYGSAAALLLPSFYEGFGLPLVEAMASGCPVIYAKAGSLPEVANEAGVALEPGDASAWAAVATALFQDADEHERLKRAGLQRSQAFDWDACAQQTCDAYAAALHPR